MKLAALALCAGLLLAGCDEQMDPNTQLPPLPVDLKSCLARQGVKIPDRALTVGEVEKLWKQDRLSIVVMRQCGERIIAWYETLRKEWR